MDHKSTFSYPKTSNSVSYHAMMKDVDLTSTLDSYLSQFPNYHLMSQDGQTLQYIMQLQMVNESDTPMKSYRITTSQSKNIFKVSQRYLWHILEKAKLFRCFIFLKMEIRTNFKDLKT